jgi:hypothetical protein
MDASVREPFRNDGAILAEDLLNEAELARCREAFVWAVANPGPAAFQIFDGSEHETHNDNANPLAKDRLEIHFVGSDIAAMTVGSIDGGIDGAIETGARAARTITRALTG